MVFGVFEVINSIGKDILVIGFDGNKDVFVFIKDGKFLVIVV